MRPYSGRVIASTGPERTLERFAGNMYEEVCVYTHTRTLTKSSVENDNRLKMNRFLATRTTLPPALQRGELYRYTPRINMDPGEWHGSQTCSKSTEGKRGGGGRDTDEAYRARSLGRPTRSDKAGFLLFLVLQLRGPFHSCLHVVSDRSKVWSYRDSEDACAYCVQ